jgi:hypothetical protein
LWFQTSLKQEHHEPDKPLPERDGRVEVLVVCVHDVPAQAEPRHGERRQDDEGEREAKVPVVVDAVVDGLGRNSPI